MHISSRLAVDLGRARAALAGLAVPADGEVGPARPGSGARRRARPCPRTTSVVVVAKLPPLAVAAPDLERRLGHLIVCRRVCDYFFSSMTCFSSAGIARNRHARAPPSRRRAPLRVDDVERAELRDLVRVVVAEVAAAALLALDRRARDRLGHGQQVVQIERRVPAGVVLAVAGDADAAAARSCSAGERRRAPAASRPRCARCRPGPASSPAASCCTWYGFSPPRRARTARARPSSPRSTCAVVDRRARRCSCANFAAYSPARLPNTSRSDSELPPSRLAPLMPGGALAGGEQPGHASTSACRASTRTPPMM